MPYRAVLLDVGETLVSPRQTFGEVYARVFAEHGLLREGPAFERALRAAWSEVEGSLVAGADRYGSHPGGERVYWRDFIRSTLRRLDGDER